MPKTILIVDDEPVVMELAKRKLEECGYVVLTAGNGEEALASLKIRLPDLIMLDVQMPKMNGYTFIIEKGRMQKYAPIPVIMLTAYNEMEPLFRRHRIKAYLPKPLQIQNLLDKVAEVIGPPG